MSLTTAISKLLNGAKFLLFAGLQVRAQSHAPDPFIKRLDNMPRGSLKRGGGKRDNGIGIIYSVLRVVIARAKTACGGNGCLRGKGTAHPVWTFDNVSLFQLSYELVPCTRVPAVP